MKRTLKSLENLLVKIENQLILVDSRDFKQVNALLNKQVELTKIIDELRWREQEEQKEKFS